MIPSTNTAITEPMALPPEERALEPQDWLRLTIPGLIWGSSFYLMAEALESFSPFLVSWLRISLGLFVIAAIPASRVPVPRSSWPRLTLLGLIWMALPLVLFPLAQERVTSSVTGMLNGATPLFVAIVAACIARRLPPRRQLIGLAVGLCGVVLIALPSWADGRSSAGGVVMVLAALSCYGFALNALGPLQRQLGSLPVIARTLAVACLMTAPLGIASIADSDFSWSSAAAVAVVGSLGTGVAYVVMGSNAGRYGSTRAASTTYLIPGVSLLLGLTLRGESVAELAVLGCVVAVLGAYLVNTAVKQRV